MAGEAEAAEMAVVVMAAVEMVVAKAAGSCCYPRHRIRYMLQRRRRRCRSIHFAC
jgi:hypothetical protein